MVRHQIEITEGLSADDTSVGIVTDIELGADKKLVLSMIEGDTKNHPDLLKAAKHLPEQSDSIIPVSFKGLEKLDVLIRLVRIKSRKTTVFMIAYGSPDTTNPDFVQLNQLLTTALYEAYRGDGASVVITHYAPGDIRQEILPGDITNR